MTLSAAKLTKQLLIAGTAFWLMLAALVTTAAAVGCPPLASKVLTNASVNSTSSQTFVDVHGTKTNFVQGGSKPGCVLVSFAAEVRAVANEMMVIRALLDGNNVACRPFAPFFVSENATPTGLASHAMNFVCEDVPPGSHSLIMQYKSSSGGTVNMENRTISVQYVP